MATALTSKHVLPGITTYLTRAALHLQALDPTQYATEDGPSIIPNLQSGTFLIGKHPDELKPMAASHRDPQACIWVSLYPKLAWSLDERFARAPTMAFSDLICGGGFVAFGSGWGS